MVDKNELDDCRTLKNTLKARNQHIDLSKISKWKLLELHRIIYLFCIFPFLRKQATRYKKKRLGQSIIPSSISTHSPTCLCLNEPNASASDFAPKKAAVCHNIDMEVRFGQHFILGMCTQMPLFHAFLA